jgi:hypothetical protein
MRPTERHALLQALDQAYDHRAWHGTNLRGSIRRVTAREAAWRPARGRHNIWELVLHCAYWKYAVRRRLRGGKRGAFARKGSNWFAVSANSGEKEWREAIALLNSEHRALRATVEAFPADRLIFPPLNSKWTALDSIIGVALHDVYHAGQIQILKRLQKKKK